MRCMKFKAWDIQNNRMLLPEQINHLSLNELLDTSKYILLNHLWKSDRNNIELFEGDYIAIYPKKTNWYGHKAVFCAVVGDDHWGFSVDWTSVFGYSCPTHILEADNYEVIGSVFNGRIDDEGNFVPFEIFTEDPLVVINEISTVDRE